MKEIMQKMRAEAARVLSSGEVDLVLGWEKGDLWWQSYPVFIENEKKAELLTWDLFCVPNLAKYLLEEIWHKKRVALFFKGCDALGFNQLMQDKRVDREKAFIFAVPCSGLVDPQKVERAGLHQGLLRVERLGDELTFVYKDREKKTAAPWFYYDKCLTCRYPNPVVFDFMLGEPVPVNPRERFTAVKELEGQNVDARFQYWQRQFSRCIRCFACRNVCPACSCRECIFDLTSPRWLGKATELSENQFYHITRAFHMAGRCVDCGECARVCPVQIPLTSLNRKLIKDIDELYGPYDAGVDPQKVPPLVTFNPGDPAAFLESKGV
ncbi:MAG: 4Fe-4S dicluster domain-containing protein [Bacillota bacterium]